MNWRGDPCPINNGPFFFLLISRSSSKLELGGVPQQPSAGQEEGVLHSVLEDLLEGRVTSTLVDNAVHGL